MGKDDRMPYAGISTPPRWDNWKKPRQRRWLRNNAPPGLGKTPPSQAGVQNQGQSWVPNWGQKPPPAFMPHMPEWEAGLRGLEDAYAANAQSLGNQQAMIGPQLNQALQRMDTDIGYATNQHMESMADRGLVDSSVSPYLARQNIQIPASRGIQDYIQSANQRYGDIASAQAENALGYNQGMAELILQNANSAVTQMPWNVPQYSTPQSSRVVNPENAPKATGKRRAPKGYHYNQKGQLVTNKGKQG